MRKNILGFVSLAAAVLFLSCERTNELLDENNKWIYADTANNASVKIVNAYAPITPALTAGAGPSLAVFVNDTQKLVGTTSAANSLAFNGTFPASTTYSLLPAGTHKLLFIQNRYTAGAFAPVAGDTVFRANVTLEKGKRYTAFLADSTQSPGVFLVQDNWTVPDPGNYQVRFANLVANPNERYDIYADSVGKMIATNIGYRQVSDFINVPIPRSTENFTVRLAGTTTVVYTLTAFAPITQRVYTLYNRGRVGVTGRAPALTWYTNR